MAPPPPPPPLCFPSFSRKPREPKHLDLVRANSGKSSGFRDSSSTLNFDPDEEKYDIDGPELPNESKTKLSRGDTIKSKSNTLMRADTKLSTPSKWGYGWGIGKMKQDERELVKQESMEPLPRPPLYHSNTRTSNRSNQSRQSNQSKESNQSRQSNQSKESGQSRQSNRSNQSKGSAASGSKKSPLRPPFWPNDSQSTLVGSAFERKVADVESIKERVDTSSRLDEMRKLMAKDNLDY